MKEQTILLKDLLPLSAEHLTEDIYFYRHLFYNSGGTFNQDQATRVENKPSSLQRDEIKRRVERFLRPHRVFLCFFFFSVEIQKSTQVDGKVSLKYLV